MQDAMGTRVCGAGAFTQGRSGGIRVVCRMQS
jgi:hypothetical protein